MVIIWNLNLVTKTALFLALTICIQALGLPQIATGPLVNMMLILAVLVVGAPGGVVVGGLTPWLAILFGIVPGQMLPVLPFLMMGNALYCLVFGVFKRHPLLGLAAASLIKFMIIGGAAKLILSLPAPMAQMLLLPQLLNAVAGGAIGIGLGLHLVKIPGTEYRRVR